MNRKFWSIVTAILVILIIAVCIFNLANKAAPASASAKTAPTSAQQIRGLGLILPAHKVPMQHKESSLPGNGVSMPTPTPTQSALPANTGTGGTPSSPSSKESQIAQAVFAAINQDRANAGLPALQWSAALAGGARLHNQKMAAANQLSHQLPGEPGLGTRISQDNIMWSWAGENIGFTGDASTQGALGLHQSMMAEQPPNDGHRQNILTTQGTIVGVDILIDSSGQLWLTEDFAKV